MFGSIAGWRAYALARGNSAPTSASDANATAALVRASDYVRSRYIANLFSPNAYNTIPSGYTLSFGEEGAYIAAAFELTTAGFFSKTFTPAQQKVLTKAGGVSWSVVGNGAGEIYGASPISTLLDNYFRPFIFDRNKKSFNMMSIGLGCLDE
jgi:hypothetical protein